jgi:uncharacterized protein (DUF885 family)
MRRLAPASALFLILTLVTPPPAARPDVAPSNGTSRKSSPAVAQVAEEAWQYQLANEPLTRLHRHLPVTSLPDVSLEQVQRDVAFSHRLLEELSHLPAEKLNEEDQLTVELLRWQAERSLDAPELYWYGFMVTPYSAPFNTVQLLLGSQSFATTADLDNYLQLLHQVPRLIGTVRASLNGQRARHVLVPKPEIDAVTTMLRGYIKPPEENPLAVGAGRLKALPAATVEPFTKEVNRIVAEEINPAYTALLAEFDDAYKGEAPEAIGIGQYPGGDHAYRLLIRSHTTLDRSPAEIHRLGLAEVSRIDKEMAEIRTQLGFTGTKAEFNQKLRTDPRFIARTPEEVGEKLMAPIRRIEPKLSAYFLQLPKAPYATARLSPALEGGMTFGYYDLPHPGEPRGIYRFNGSRLEERPLVNAAPLIYHELVPGHHFQLARQMENESLPEFRRELYHNAFVEGWGEYASALAGEMGMYSDPYDHYGRLSMDMFLSVRLVVDTGMNALGWSRERAMAFMRENELESDAQIASESLRYASDMPGQALAYKLGSMKIRELRDRAQRELGNRFDIRRFHEAVIGSGSLPLPILERHIERWIAAEKAAPKS